MSQACKTLAQTILLGKITSNLTSVIFSFNNLMILTLTTETRGSC